MEGIALHSFGVTGIRPLLRLVPPQVVSFFPHLEPYHGALDALDALQGECLFQCVRVIVIVVLVSSCWSSCW